MFAFKWVNVYRRYTKVYIPVPTWSNHHQIWADAGCEEKTFRYYKPETRGLDFDGMMEDIKGADEAGGCTI
jgi:aspartate aminotransferase